MDETITPMKFDRETKNKRVFVANVDPGTAPVIDTLYIPKWVQTDDNIEVVLRPQTK